MHKKRKYILYTIIILLLPCIFVYCFWDKNFNDNELKFLQTYGTIDYEKNIPLTLSVAFISNNKDILDMENINVKLNDDNIHIDKVDLRKCDSTMKYTLWCLYLDCIISTDKESIDITEVILNNVSYPIGCLTLNDIAPFDWSHEHLDLRQHTGATFGKGLEKAMYHAFFRNVTDETVYVTNFYAPQYTKAIPYYSINSNEKNVGFFNKIEVESQDILEVGFDLNDCVVNGVDVYYISPILQYEFNQEKRMIALPYYTSGMNLSKTEINEIGDRLFKGKVFNG